MNLREETQINSMEKTIQNSKKHILIAEDSKAQSKMLVSSLTACGYLVDSAENGLDALHRLSQRRPDLIISDVEMPKMDGLKFCNALKSDNDLRTIPFILLTKYSNIGGILHGLEVGADFYITKPYDMNMLLTKVAFIFSDGYRFVKNGDRTNVEIFIDGEVKKYCLDPQKILNFFSSTYENLLSNHSKVLQTRKEMQSLNNHLESLVLEKTNFLEKEILEREMAQETLKESYNTIRNTLGGTVIALSMVIETRDPYTAGHQRRVAELAVAISRTLGWSEERTEGVQVMGFLHDLGKMTIPSEILSRPCILNEVEFELIKLHSRVGYNILSGIEFPWPVKACVVQHHERMNGSGYPDGMREEEIIPEARIIAVADVVEAMASHRPYRPALGIEKALEEIASNKGKLYDSQVVDACLTAFHINGFNFENS